MVTIFLKVSILALTPSLCFGSKESKAYYITPSTSTVCPAEPCLTLSQFANNVSYLKPNTIVLMFLRGNHSLDSNISVKSIKKISMLQYSSSSHLSVRIICQQNVSFKFTNISYLLIKRLNFFGCGNNQVLRVDQFLIEESTFIGQKLRGSVLELIETNMYIVSSSFISNKLGSYRGPIRILEHQNVEKRVAVYAYVGGAIIANQSNLTIMESMFEGNSAEVGGAMFATLGTNITIINSTFVANYLSCRPDLQCFGGALHSENEFLQCQVVVVESDFRNNSASYGGVMSTYNCTVGIASSIFFNNAAIFSGGVIWVQHRSGITLCDSTFAYNSAQQSGGAISLANSSSLAIDRCQFYNNTAGKYGGVLTASAKSELNVCDSKFWNNALRGLDVSGGVIFLTSAIEVIINRCQFHNNAAGVERDNAGAGGVLGIYNQSCVTIYDSEFWNNWGQFAGGVLYTHNSSVKNSSSQFHSNTGLYQAGVLNIWQSFVTIYKSMFHGNSVNGSGGGVIVIHEASNLTIYQSQFMSNRVNKSGGVLASTRASVIIKYSEFIGNHASTYGGVIWAVQSGVILMGTYMSGNAATIGGAIHAYDSKLQVYGNTTVMNNIASDSGGGIYLYRSDVTCQHHSTLKLLRNRATSKGGGMHIIISVVTILSDRSSSVESSLHFTGNVAQMGGGVYLETVSELHVLKSGVYSTENRYLNKTKTNLYFTTNSADYGGAVYVDDETNFGACNNSLSVSTGHAYDCFLQVISTLQEHDIVFDIVTVNFTQNDAQRFGSSIFGGLLDRCTINYYAEIRYYGRNLNGISGVHYFKNFSNINTASISSYTVQVCFCRPNGQPDCRYQPPSIQVRKGENFTVPLVAVDQISHVIKDVAVYGTLRSKESGLGVGQMTQITRNDCTYLNFSVYSPNPSEELTLYGDGPCKDAGKSQRRISIKFLKCTCPVGFQPKLEVNNNNCECVCDSKLYPYIADPNCNPYTKSLIRSGNFWITYLNDTDTSGDYHYLIYPHCPLDYCYPAIPNVLMSLVTANGADAQCANNRTGILCGVCQPGLSLSLGSSHCVACSKAWPMRLAAIIVAAFLSGIVFVVLLLVLNLTVAVGTLNGLIFCANIIDANSSIFFPHTIQFIQTFRVIFSWLNLKAGIDTCFLEGMDAYWKTWLQLAFPTYVMFLVFVTIVVSERSVKFTRLILKRNPVATLATLILLSYTTLLRTIIAVLSFANLDYPDGSHKCVWLPDATVEYLNGRHIILFIMAFVILVVGGAYTCLLFFWQWLNRCQDNPFFRWVSHQKLRHFIEVYHAPYVDKHRYWTGLLLLSRVVLYLTFALNVSGDPRVNLLAIIVVTSCILFLKGYFGQIYKAWIVDKVEVACYLNVNLFSTTILFTLEAGRDQTVVVYISGAITSVLLLAILTYHVFTELCATPFIRKRFKHMGKRSDDNQEVSYNQSDYQTLDSDTTEPTFTIINGLPNRDRPLPVMTDSKSKQDKRSNSLQPLGKDSNDSKTSLSLLKHSNE